MQSAARTTFGVIAVLAGLAGVAACGNPSSPGTTPISSPNVSIPAAPNATGSAPGTPSPVGTATVAATSSAQREVNPAGDIPDNQAYVPYSSTTGKFTLTVPEGWARTDTTSGVIFTDKYNSIRVETRATTSAPTAASVRSSEVPTLSGSATNFQLVDVTMVNRKAGAAVLLTYHADTPPNPVTGKVTTAAFERYIFFKAGTEVLITVGAPVGGDNVDPWRKVTDSFSWSV